MDPRQYPDYISQLEQEVDRLGRDLQKQELELKKRDVEMQSLRKFVDKLDDSHAADFKALLDDINAFTSQVANAVSFEWTLPPSNSSPVVKDTWTKRLTVAIGTRLFTALDACRTENTDNASTLLKYAVQAIVLHKVKRIVYEFGPGLSSETNELLEELSLIIQEQESQPTYGRWRAITHRHLATLSQKERQEAAIQHQNDTLQLIYYASHVLSGVYSTKSEWEELCEIAHNDIAEVYDTAFKLATMLKEGVVTQNVEVYWPQKDRFNPELMEMLYPIPQSSETDFASVVTGLGLRLQKSEHSEEDRVLQKATVVTQRMLDVEHTKALAVRRANAYEEPNTDSPVSAQITSERPAWLNTIDSSEPGEDTATITTEITAETEKAFKAVREPGYDIPFNTLAALFPAITTVSLIVNVGLVAWYVSSRRSR